MKCVLMVLCCFLNGFGGVLLFFEGFLDVFLWSSWRFLGWDIQVFELDFTSMVPRVRFKMASPSKALA